MEIGEGPKVRVSKELGQKGNIKGLGSRFQLLDEDEGLGLDAEGVLDSGAHKVVGEVSGPKVLGPSGYMSSGLKASGAEKVGGEKNGPGKGRNRSGPYDRLVVRNGPRKVNNNSGLGQLKVQVDKFPFIGKCQTYPISGNSIAQLPSGLGIMLDKGLECTNKPMEATALPLCSVNTAAHGREELQSPERAGLHPTRPPEVIEVVSDGQQAPATVGEAILIEPPDPGEGKVNVGFGDLGSTPNTGDTTLEEELAALIGLEEAEMVEVIVAQTPIWEVKGFHVNEVMDCSKEAWFTTKISQQQKHETC